MWEISIVYDSYAFMMVFISMVIIVAMGWNDERFPYHSTRTQVTKKIFDFQKRVNHFEFFIFRCQQRKISTIKRENKNLLANPNIACGNLLYSDLSKTPKSHP